MIRYWFEYVVPKKLATALVFGTLAWLTLAVVFVYLLGGFDSVLTPDTISARGVGLFFASVSVFGVMAGAFVLRRGEKIVQGMVLSCTPEQQLELSNSVVTQTKKRAVTVVVLSLIAGLGHNMLLQGTVVGVLPNMFSSTIAAAGSLGAMLAWFILSHIVNAFVTNAIVFARIGEQFLEVDLIQRDSFMSLGQAALLPTLGLIGTQSLYPLLWVGSGDINIWAVWPGFFATSAAVIILFFRTTLPLHRRLCKIKQAQIDEVNKEVAAVRGEQKIDYVQLNALLAHKTYLEDAPEWPFKISTVARWSLYLLIPPLTWVGAALIEIVVDGLVVG